MQHAKPLDLETPEESPKPPCEIVRVPKNVTPNRFWAMVEPYCAEITPDDIKYLEDQIKNCEDVTEYMKIPALGKPYAEKWAEEDLLSEQRDGSFTFHLVPL